MPALLRRIPGAAAKRSSTRAAWKASYRPTHRSSDADRNIYLSHGTTFEEGRGVLVPRPGRQRKLARHKALRQWAMSILSSYRERRQYGSPPRLCSRGLELHLAQDRTCCLATSSGPGRSVFVLRGAVAILTHRGDSSGALHPGMRRGCLGDASDTRWNPNIQTTRIFRALSTLDTYAAGARVELAAVAPTCGKKRGLSSVP